MLAKAFEELMFSLSPKFTAYQGFDALFHSTECYISKANNRMGDMLALTAIENIGRYLVRAVKDGSDPEAREGVAFANNMSGQVMISAAYYQHFADCAQDFVDLLVLLQKDCGVADLKMSDFGIREEEYDRLAENARETMGGLFTADPKELSHEECVAIYQKSYR